MGAGKNDKYVFSFTNFTIHSRKRHKKHVQRMNHTPLTSYNYKNFYYYIFAFSHEFTINKTKTIPKNSTVNVDDTDVNDGQYDP